MAEDTMPVTEAALDTSERDVYECSFHILPTVADEEVPASFEAIKAVIAEKGGELFDEEAPLQFDLAYEITKSVEGSYQRFTSSYFGWVRFRAEAVVVRDIKDTLSVRPDMLRLMIVKLTREEETAPFRVFEKKSRLPEEVGEDVSEEELDESIEKITGEEKEG